MTEILPAEKFEYDRSLPLNVRDETPPEKRGDVTLRDVSYDGAPGVRLNAYVISPPGEGPFPAILYYHWLESGHPTSNRTQFVDEAMTMAQKGVVSVLPDGVWKSSPMSWAVLAKKEWFWRSDPDYDIATSVRQVIDCRRSLDLLLAQPGVDARRVGYIGHDFGAMYGAMMSAVDKRVKAYALLAGTATFEWFLFGAEMTHDQELAYMQAVECIDPRGYISKAAPANLYFQFGHADYFIPERMAQLFYEAASQPKEISWYEAQHDLAHEEAQPDRVRWISQQLGL
jgi:dienelactone hydrolase